MAAKILLSEDETKRWRAGENDLRRWTRRDATTAADASRESCSIVADDGEVLEVVSPPAADNHWLGLAE